MCYFGTYSAGAGYPVNRVLIEGLRRAGATVWECRAGAADDGEERWKSAQGPLAWLRGAGRMAVAWIRLVARWISGPPTDVVIVGYLGHLDVFLARLLTRRPVALNALLSLHDTVVRDRGLASERSLAARLLRGIDRSACRAADLVLLDTNAHIAYFREQFGLDHARFLRVPVGSDRSGRPAAIGPSGASVRVLFVGTFIPLHGVRTIVAAAQRVEQRGLDIRFRLIGRGQEFAGAAELVGREGLTRVELVDRWINGDAYERELAAADICLGIFGATDKARRVIPSKVYDALAAGRPLITADTPAARELLTHGVDAWLCPPDDPAALADALATLAGDRALRARLAEGARRTYEARCSPDAIGRDVLVALERLVRSSSPAAGC
ncbi:MAG TPA: glycosyltransferase family 4 protein [Nitrospiria bacterium]|nr:glycosyltransferase family 4 protein [Nitrospiria bacterium]